jgi:hypothetical protein
MCEWAVSPVTGLFCHRRMRIWFCLSPVGPTQLREIDASVGADHTILLSAAIVSRQRAVDRSQVPKNPPCDPIARKTLPRPPHPAPYVRDDRDTPLFRDGMARVLDVIWQTGLDRRNQIDRLQQIAVFARAAFLA